MATFIPVGKLSYHRITHNMFIAKKHINVDEQLSTLHGGTSTTIPQNSVLQAIPVRTGDVVLTCWVEVYTSCTGGASIDVGVGENVDAWVDAAPLDGQLVDANQSAASDCPHRFSAADTIDATVLEAAVTAGKFAVCALIVRI